MKTPTPLTQSATDSPRKLKSGGWVRALIPVVVLLATAPASAQITTTNQYGSFWGNYNITLNNWHDVRFITDANAYTLNYVTLSMASIVNSSGSFTVRIYSGPGAYPGTLLETLSGSDNPSGWANYTSAGLALAPNTYYHVVAGVTSGAGNYQWGSTNTPGVQAGPFGFDYGFNTSTDQAASWPSGTALAMQYAVTATAIPEPSTYVALAGVVALGLALWRRGKRRLVQVS